jgi:uncharacterized protein
MSDELQGSCSNGAGERKELQVGPSRIQGSGLFAQSAVAEGERIIEYTGQRISKTESVQRCSDGNHFIFDLDHEYDLDGSVDSNLARFINHHCSPNCTVELIDGRLWVIAARNIAAGEELSYDYGYDLSDYRDFPCNCGGPNCVGYIVAEEFRASVTGARESFG